MDNWVHDESNEINDQFKGCSSVTLDEFIDKCEEFRSNDFSVLHLNIRGCRTNFDDFSSFLATLDKSFSCIALTETNITNDIDVNYGINGYKCENLYTGHGIKLYIKETLTNKRVDTLSICNEVIESIFVKLSFKYNKDIIVGAVYRPHSSSVRTFTEYFNVNILRKLKPHQTAVLYGDFNINFRHSCSDPSISEFVNLMQSHNLNQYVTEITRLNTTNIANSSIIDHIWTNFNRSFSTYVIECGISDHYPVLFQTEFVNTFNVSKITFRDYSLHNYEKFLAEFPNRWYSSNLPLTNVSDSVGNFINWLNNIMNFYFPLKTKQIGHKRLRNPWINDGLLVCIKKKHNYYKLMKKGQLSQQFYNKYRNHVTYAIKTLKKQYYNNAFVTMKSDIKGTWRLLNEILDRKQKDSISELLINGETSSDPVLIANTFNNFFSSISSELRDSLPPVNNSNPFNILPSCRNSIFLIRSTASEVASVINSFENKKCNTGDIPFKILKSVSPLISDHLSALFNLMIEDGCYPDCLKIANITPVFKSGNNQLCNNYRPISVLKNLNKVFEKLLLKRLNNFFTINNVFYEHQYGFTAKKGTTDACIRVINSIQSAFREGKYAISVFYDFKKAFDTVDHNRLLFKLEKSGIRGCALNLLKSYLDDRYQSVAIKSCSSSMQSVLHGVPHGSILGLILFNIYINDLHYFLQQTFLTHYADDTSTLCSDSNLKIIFQRTQDCLNIFQSWANANYLTVNTHKTSYLLFSPRISECIVPHNLTINNISLERLHFIKYLGLLIDDKLRFDIHISNICTRLSRAAGVSFVVGNKLSYEAARCLYFSFTHSIISHLLLFWGASIDCCLIRVQVLQNRVVRNLFGHKIVHDNTTDLFHKANILKVKDLYYKELGISFYKALYLNQYDTLTESLRSLNWSHNYNTRKINHFRLPYVKSTTEARHLLFRGVQFWNSLPLKLRAAASLLTFKKMLQQHLIDKYSSQFLLG